VNLTIADLCWNSTIESIAYLTPNTDAAPAWTASLTVLLEKLWLYASRSGDLD
jgi:hypothetical protein